MKEKCTNNKKKDVYKGISGDVGKWFDIKFCWKKKKTTITCKKKSKKWLRLINDKNVSEIITKCPETVLKLYSYCVHKDNKKIEDWKCTRAKGVNKLRGKNLRFPDYENVFLIQQ